MRYSTYRDRALRDYTYSPGELLEIDWDDTEYKEGYVPCEELKEVIDDIESDVNDVIGVLERISGVDLVDEAVEMLKKLSEKLY